MAKEIIKLIRVNTMLFEVYSFEFYGFKVRELICV